MQRDTARDSALKPALRLQYRELRGRQPREEFERKCDAITSAVLSLDEVARAKCVYTYVSFPGEVDTRDIILKLLGSGKTVVAPGPTPTLSPQDEIEEIVAEGTGFRLQRLTRSDIKQIDVFLVPGIVWDRHGYRVGFGSGYFDRLLAWAPKSATSIGLSFDFQLLETVPHDAWDIPVKSIVTEREIIRVA